MLEMITDGHMDDDYNEYNDERIECSDTEVEVKRLLASLKFYTDMNGITRGNSDSTITVGLSSQLLLSFLQLARVVIKTIVKMMVTMVIIVSSTLT